MFSTDDFAQGRQPKREEGEIAYQLLNLIVYQSGCEKYAVAWLDNVTQQIWARCANTPEESQEILQNIPPGLHFIADTMTFKITNPENSELLVERKPASLLGYYLSKIHNLRVHAPLLLYRADLEESFQRSANLFHSSNSSSPKIDASQSVQMKRNCGNPLRQIR